MSSVRITQLRSSNGSSEKQLATLRSLGLGKVGSSTERKNSEELNGMIRAVQHLVKVENV